MEGQSRGIIPARAGFTTTCLMVDMYRTDHPRSRGVYSRASARTAGTRWIIPARAGFTQPDHPTRAGESDHPRSRGVYGPEAEWKARVEGSSPLARGLRPPASWWTCTARIIPARAGFTKTMAAASGAASDHPRSRGVYPRVGGTSRSRAGSSPLARGLRILVVPLGWFCGIIPARAGFTMMHSTQTHSCADHPRSRGVYRPPSGAGRPKRGSSPLARGLQNYI